MAGAYNSYNGFAINNIGSGSSGTYFANSNPEYNPDVEWEGWEEEWGGGFGDDPLILNLTGQPVQTVSVAQSSAYFDMGDDGQRVRTGWGTAGEAYLVNDTDSTGEMRSISDLISGFSELRSFDSNSDGMLNSNDDAWNDIKIWVDQAGNADVRTASLLSLNQIGIDSINLNANPSHADSSGNVIVSESNFLMSNGITGDIQGLYLRFDPAEILSPSSDSIEGIKNNPNQFSGKDIGGLSLG